MKKIYFLIISISILIGNKAAAQLIFEEPFDYPIGNLQGNGTGTGFPVGSIWSNTTTAAVASIGNVANAQIVSGSLGSSGTGNKVQICTETGKTSFFDRSISLTLNDDNVTDYFLGFWFRTASTLSTGTYAVPAQLIFMNTPNTTVSNDMRLGFGKSSNVGLANILTGFTRASGEACGGAASWPAQLTNGTTAGSNYGGGIGANTLNLPDGQSTYYILAKITKKEFTIQAGSPLTSQYFDGVRIWFLNAPPIGINDPIFTSRPNGDVLTTVAGGGIPPATPSMPNYLLDNPIQTRALRSSGSSATAPLYSSQICATVAGGVTGIRLRVEGGNTNCFEFDEIRLSVGLPGLFLSLNLDDLKAFEIDNQNNIQWKTNAGNNTKGFIIQKSNTGENWEKIGYIDVSNSSSKNLQYQFLDNNPFDITYYRIVQEDKSGNVNYSKTVKVKRNEKVKISLSPNPAVNNLNVMLNKNSKQNILNIYDFSGKTVFTKIFNGYRDDINLNSFAKGIYLIKIVTENGVTVKKFIKE